jgi:hypothetical protein
VRRATFAALAVAILPAPPGVLAAKPKEAPKPVAPKTAPGNSASAQYGKKVVVCSVTALGRQRTIEFASKGVPAYLGAHPRAFVGSCTHPRKVKPNVCIRLTRTKHVAVWVPERLLKPYLRRNAGSYRTLTGKCTRR